jgi:dolichyl-phosphate beta-glucosyltransferase
MWGFHTFLSIMIGGAGIKDTQCGFKLFSRQAARQLFPVQHIERWAFDVELVYLAAKKGIPMVVRGAACAE